MPLLIPPRDGLYNGRNFVAGMALEVLERDIAALLGVGWKRPPKAKPKAVKPEVAKKERNDVGNS